MRSAIAGSLVLTLCACSEPAERTADEAAAPAAAPAPSAAAEPASPYIGLEHAVTILPPDFPVPEGHELESITYLDNPGFAGSSPNNALSRVRGPNGLMIWLEELVRREGANTAVWRVAGVLNVTQIDEASEALIVSKGCTLNDRPEPNVVAVARVEQPIGQMFSNFRKAWRANLAGRTFDEISTAGLRCPTR